MPADTNDTQTAGSNSSLALTRSRAYSEASLRGEFRRACAVLGVLGLISLLLITSGLRRGLPRELLAVGATAVAALALVQGVVMVMIARSRRRGQPMPYSLMAVTVVFECLVPTAILSWHVVRGVLPPYAVLGTPAVLAYGILITLTTLRLYPSLCILAGSVSSAGYAGLLAYVYFGLKSSEPSTGIPQAAYLNFSLLILITGLGAAWVAHEIRGHFIAALGEAETKLHMARIERDLAAARSIQQALLPRRVPAIATYDIAGWNRSADQTGGDYYDWQQLPDGRWIITLADVSGHGIGPAMVTAACRAYMRAGSSHHPDLSSLVSHINNLLADDLQEGRFVTLATVAIDPASPKVRVLSAGHGPIVLYVSSTSQVSDIIPDDLPLAIVPDMEYSPGASIELAPGDILALLTDGFVEWARPAGQTKREQYGVERLRAALRTHAHLPAADLIAAVAKEVADFAQGEPQQDDLTMVVIKRTASAVA